MVSAAHPQERQVQIRLLLPISTRLRFTEVRASISRRAGESVNRPDALRVLCDVYGQLSDPDATRLTLAVLHKFAEGRPT
jgi:hypothetical protein